MDQQDVLNIMRDPRVEKLMQSEIIARIGYTGRDGAPRVIPIGYEWDGTHIVICTPSIAPKVKALRSNPKVAITIDTNAFPPNILLIRGIAAIDIVQGVAPEYFRASRRVVPPEGWENFVSQVTAMYKEMAVIRISPAWAKFMDFQTSLPQTVEKLAKAAGLA